MNKKLLALAVAGALAAPLSAQAVDVSSYGQVGAKIVSEKDHSLDLAARDFRLGFQAVDDTSAGKFIGQLEFDLDSTVAGSVSAVDNNGDPIPGVNVSAGSNASIADIRTARVLWVTQGAGTFVFAPRTASGNYDDMVAMTDIFGVGKGLGLFSQGSRVSHVIAWKSPTSGGLFGALAVVASDSGLTSTTGDKADADASVWRLVYNGGGLHVGVGAVSYATDGAAATASDRTNLGVSYTMGNLYFGGSYEDQDDANNTSTIALAASMAAGANTFKIGHTTLSSDNAAVDGAAITEIEVAHDFSKNTSSFVSYWTENQEAGDSNAVTAGLKVTW